MKRKLNSVTAAKRATAGRQAGIPPFSPGERGGGAGWRKLLSLSLVYMKVGYDRRFSEGLVILAVLC